MLTKNVSVNVTLVEEVVLGKSCTKTGSIEDCTGTDNSLLGKTGNLAECVCKNVNRVTYDYVNCIGCIAGNLGDDALCDFDVCLSKVKSGKILGFSR